MATVVNVPRDTRFGEVGEGLGNLIGMALETRRQKKLEDQKTKGVDALFDRLADPDPTKPAPNRAEASAILRESGFRDQREISELIDLVFKERDRLAEQRFTSSEREAGEEFRSELQEDQQRFLEEQNRLERESKLEAAKIRSGATGSARTITLHHPDGRTREITVPPSVKSEEGVQAYVQGLVQDNPRLEGFSTEEPKDLTESERTTAQIAKDLQKQFPDMTPAQAQQAAQRVKTTRAAAISLVQDQFGEVQKDSEGNVLKVIYGDPGQLLKARRAMALVQDIIAEGEDNPGAAAEQAGQQAEEWYKTAQFVPENIRKNERGQIAVNRILEYSLRELNFPKHVLRELALGLGWQDQHFDEWIQKRSQVK